LKLGKPEAGFLDELSVLLLSNCSTLETNIMPKMKRKAEVHAADQKPSKKKIKTCMAFSPSLPLPIANTNNG
jgi:hypothetical protein